MTVYETRWEFIEEHVRNMRVLDVGPAELVGTINKDKLDRWLHAKIANIANKTVGLEKNSEQVKILAEMGYKLRQGDAEEFELDEQFDVVFAGELIEHLSNPGRFLQNAHEHLVCGGRLLITTPNRYSVRTLSKVISSGNVPRYTKPIDKHVICFDSDMMSSLLRRHGFSDISVDYCKWVGAPGAWRRGNWLVQLCGRVRPALLPVMLIRATRTD